MWPFKRRHSDKRDLEITENWSVSEGTYDGNLLIVRVNRGVAQAVGHSAFPHRVGVAVPLRLPDSNGFPGPEEAEQLQQVEELLSAELGADRQSLYVASISTGGMREFVFYTSDPAATHNLLDRLAKTVTTHELQHIIEPDPKWTVYGQFA